MAYLVFNTPHAPFFLPGFVSFIVLFVTSAVECQAAKMKLVFNRSAGPLNSHGISKETGQVDATFHLQVAGFHQLGEGRQRSVSYRGHGKIDLSLDIKPDISHNHC